MPQNISFYKVKIIAVFILLIVCFSCKNEHKTSNDFIDNNTKVNNVLTSTQDSFFVGQKVSAIDKNIRSIYQDKKGHFWFGTNSSGVYKHDGKTLRQFTVKDGLYHDQVLTIQEDNSGNLWFGTGAFGVSSFDGKRFTTQTIKENLSNNNQDSNRWQKKSDDLWFPAGAGVFRFSGKKIDYLPLDKRNLKRTPNAPFELSSHAVYSILRDKKGNLWFGTQSQGVCRYDGKDFRWFTENGLKGPAVLGLFEDSRGNIWMGNNGAGLFKYDGKTLLNFTEKNNLDNPSFRTAGNAQPGTLARIYTINEDLHGNIWIGTVDAGVWKYDGNYLTNYSSKDGLSTQAINAIYRDNKGNLWFGSDTDGLFKLNGNTFEQVNL
jgi:ligand-binding sensor domain-containing protein